MDPAPRLFTRPFVLACLASFAFYLAHQMVLVAIPLYVLGLGGGKTDAGTLTLVFAMAALIGRFPVGWAIDRWGRSRILIAGMGIAAVSVLLCALVDSLPGLLGVRPLHGVAMALVSTAAAVIVADVVPRARSGEGMAIFGMGRDAALAFGPVMALALAGNVSFDAVFVVAAGAAGAGMVLGYAAGETGSVAAARAAPDRAAPRPAALGFVRSAVLPAVLVGMLTVAHGSLVTFLALLGESRDVGNPGLFFTANAIVVVAVRAKAGALSDRRGRGAAIVPGMLIVGLAMAVVAIADAPWGLVVAGALYGLGSGLAQPALMALVGDRIRSTERARAMTTFYTGWELGIGLGAFALGAVLEHTSFGVIYGIAGIIAAGGAVVYRVFAPESSKRDVDRP